jgi:hypothetical protein
MFSARSMQAPLRVQVFRRWPLAWDSRIHEHAVIQSCQADNLPHSSRAGFFRAAKSTAKITLISPRMSVSTPRTLGLGRNLLTKSELARSIQNRLIDVSASLAKIVE